VPANTKAKLHKQFFSAVCCVALYSPVISDNRCFMSARLRPLGFLAGVNDALLRRKKSAMHNRSNGFT
jgi:hypothetical protein